MYQKLSPNAAITSSYIELQSQYDGWSQKHVKIMHSYCDQFKGHLRNWMEIEQMGTS